ncbi:hypothetical protein KC19_2G154800 [Ceratodon purpureus]|uniref:HIG1 domain-containing protein n=1 Tax=Ceratodon purpureus TaxID=3225 RepID=A0A8T0IX44_CERPU|nr:hypothetical protein KC19_2G154800 [Ceratodon purpureus]
MNRGEVPEEFAAMKTSSSEVLHDHSVADDIHMVEVEDMFGNNRKGKRNPLVICGAIATAGVLVAGLFSFRQGNFRRSQMLMRTRVGFQAATVALMVGSVYFQGKA